ALTADPADEKPFLGAAQELLRPVHVSAIGKLDPLSRRRYMNMEADLPVIAAAGRTVLVEAEVKSGELLLQGGNNATRPPFPRMIGTEVGQRYLETCFFAQVRPERPNVEADVLR